MTICRFIAAAMMLGAIVPARAQDAEPMPRLTITKPVPPPEAQPVQRAVTSQDQSIDQELKDTAVASLNEQAASTAETCDTPLKARIDWSTIAPQELAGSAPARECGAALTALAEACANSAARQKIQAEVQEIICTAGSPAPALDLRAGALLYTIDWQAHNPAVFIYSWLLQNL